MTPALVDTHVHLTFGALGEAPDRYWDSARRAGVLQAIVVGIDAATSLGVVEFAGRRTGLFCAVGIHPNECSAAAPDDLTTIQSLLGHEKVVAVGESGLDLYRTRSDLASQRASLDAQAKMALEAGLPLVLHLRDAFSEAPEALETWVLRGLRAVVHCFTGGPKDLQPFVDWGFMVSFSGILTYPKADALREAAALVPDKLLLLETDAPWLTPQRWRGRTNEPAFVVDTARELAKVADLLGLERAGVRRYARDRRW